MHTVGFSTGAIALGDFDEALRLLAPNNFSAVELSALRVGEVQPLLEALPRLDLTQYSFVSYHAPSSFSSREENTLVELLRQLPGSWPIVLHPDAIHEDSLWAGFGSRILIENMDRRKPIGRTSEELAAVFARFPDARMCFDVGHARQIDPSMSEAYLILRKFSERIVQVHVSEVDAFSRHGRISFAAEIAFRQIAPFLPDDVPLILESRVEKIEIASEARKALDIFSAVLVPA